MKLNLLRSSLLFALLFTVPVVMFSQKTGNPVIINDVQDNSNVSKAETVYGPQHYKVAPTQDTDRLKKLKREFSGDRLSDKHKVSEKLPVEEIV